MTNVVVMNLHKSEEGWRRFQQRTDKGKTARRAMMDATPSGRKGNGTPTRKDHLKSR